MINLLPPGDKRQIRAGRSNALLLRYNILLVVAVGFLMAAIGVVYVYLGNTKLGAEQVIKENQAKVADFAETENKANEFKNNLAIAKQILGKEVIYTKVILEISALTPKGVVLDSLNLDAKNFGTQTTLSAHAKNINDAIALKTSFQNSTLFSNVNFQSISTEESGGSYPIRVNLNVTINKDATK
jgi:Tfp pilus assembly protein PilN